VLRLEFRLQTGSKSQSDPGPPFPPNKNTEIRQIVRLVESSSDKLPPSAGGGGGGGGGGGREEQLRISASRRTIDTISRRSTIFFYEFTGTPGDLVVQTSAQQPSLNDKIVIAQTRAGNRKRPSAFIGRLVHPTNT